MKPKVPGSEKIGRDRIGISSPMRLPFLASAPTKELLGVATKKKLLMAGGPAGSSSSRLHIGSATSSMRLAMPVVVSRL